MSKNKFLDFSNESLESLEMIPYISEESNVRSLVLDLNSIQQIYFSSLNRFPNLEHLSISKNKVSYMDSADNLLKIKSINLSRNQLKTMKGLTGITSLAKIIVSKNNICAIENEISFPLLRYLDIRMNPLNEWNSIGFSSLRNLCVDGCKFSSILFIKLIPSLEKLSAVANNIFDFEPFEHSSVNEIDLSTNSITSLDCFSLFPSLKILQLSDNPIDGGVCTLINLESLNISKSQFNNLSNHPSIPNVRILNVSYTCINSISDAIQIVSSSKKLKIFNLKSSKTAIFKSSSGRIQFDDDPALSSSCFETPLHHYSGRVESTNDAEEPRSSKKSSSNIKYKKCESSEKKMHHKSRSEINSSGHSQREESDISSHQRTRYSNTDCSQRDMSKGNHLMALNEKGSHYESRGNNDSSCFDHLSREKSDLSSRKSKRDVNASTKILKGELNNKSKIGVSLDMSMRHRKKSKHYYTLSVHERIKRHKKPHLSVKHHGQKKRIVAHHSLPEFKHYCQSMESSSPPENTEFCYPHVVFHYLEEHPLPEYDEVHEVPLLDKPTTIHRYHEKMPKFEGFEQFEKQIIQQREFQHESFHQAKPLLLMYPFNARSPRCIPWDYEEKFPLQPRPNPLIKRSSFVPFVEAEKKIFKGEMKYVNYWLETALNMTICNIRLLPESSKIDALPRPLNLMIVQDIQTEPIVGIRVVSERIPKGKYFLCALYSKRTVVFNHSASEFSADWINRSGKVSTVVIRDTREIIVLYPSNVVRLFSFYL